MTVLRSTLALAAGTVLLVASACASGASSGTSQNPNLLTRDEITAANVPTLHDAIQRLRPRWLTSRGPRSLSGLSTDIVVYQDQTLLGGIDVLRQLSPDMVTQIRWLDGSTATASLPGLGSRHVEGAIVIQTRTTR
jgi:hypothetical protein